MITATLSGELTTAEVAVFAAVRAWRHLQSGDVLLLGWLIHSELCDDSVLYEPDRFVCEIPGPPGSTQSPSASPDVGLERAGAPPSRCGRMAEWMPVTLPAPA